MVARSFSRFCSSRSCMSCTSSFIRASPASAVLDRASSTSSNPLTIPIGGSIDPSGANRAKSLADDTRDTPSCAEWSPMPGTSPTTEGGLDPPWDMDFWLEPSVSPCRWRLSRWMSSEVMFDFEASGPSSGMLDCSISSSLAFASAFCKRFCVSFHLDRICRSSSGEEKMVSAMVLDSSLVVGRSPLLFSSDLSSFAGLASFLILSIFSTSARALRRLSMNDDTFVNSSSHVFSFSSTR
mmetsp:Transcript_8804/g.16658  ORF Transcript_8804/g.16658 Transcript_8804/m.16658 type:complete len:239 (-) Transcript_8804:23317-24033(-)